MERNRDDLEGAISQFDDAISKTTVDDPKHAELIRDREQLVNMSKQREANIQPRKFSTDKDEERQRNSGLHSWDTLLLESLFLVMAICLFLFSGWAFSEYFAAGDWIAREAIVSERNAEPRIYRGKRRLSTTVKYTYSVSKNTYTGSFMPEGKVYDDFYNQDLCWKALNKNFPEGKSINIAYDPDHPSLSTFERKAELNRAVQGLGFAALFATMGIFFRYARLKSAKFDAAKKE